MVIFQLSLELSWYLLEHQTSKIRLLYFALHHFDKLAYNCRMTFLYSYNHNQKLEVKTIKQSNELEKYTLWEADFYSKYQAKFPNSATSRQEMKYV